MASQNLDVGTGANANDGQSLRSAFVNVRKMFHDVYGISSAYTDSLDISGEDFKVNANQINTTNSAASGVDGYVLTYDHSTGGFTLKSISMETLLVYKVVLDYLETLHLERLQLTLT